VSCRCASLAPFFHTASVRSTFSLPLPSPGLNHRLPSVFALCWPGATGRINLLLPSFFFCPGPVTCSWFSAVVAALLGLPEVFNTVWTEFCRYYPFEVRCVTYDVIRKRALNYAASSVSTFTEATSLALNYGRTFTTKFSRWGSGGRDRCNICESNVCFVILGSLSSAIASKEKMTFIATDPVPKMEH
jgi:hypothetical protein